jgi:beta-glucanase (GH16 family)
MKTFLRCWLFLLIASPAFASGWKLVWSDEFDKPGPPDPAKWNYEAGFVRNHEAQYYTRDRRENARVENGLLIIEARKEQFRNPAFDPAAKDSRNWNRSREFAAYTSASLTTQGNANWTYGRIEVRAKLPAGRGVWPAIWTLGTNTPQAGWPAGGEIDIMEMVGFKPDMIYAHVHVRKYDVLQKTDQGNGIKIPDASDAFHVYAVEWDADHMDFFVDDQKYFTYRNEKTGSDAWPFDKGQYLILNLAIGGAWGGEKGLDDNILPQRFYIDYVRVYQKQP